MPVDQGAAEHWGGAPGATPSESPGPQTTPTTGEAVVKISALYNYVREWRHTSLGGITYNIAVCPQCRAVIEPLRTRRSRSGTHGEDYYEHQHPLSFVELRQSNAGNRRFGIYNSELLSESDLTNLTNLVKRAWIFRDYEPEDIERLVDNYLKTGEVRLDE